MNIKRQKAIVVPELRSKSDLDLLYEFCLWDYEPNKHELDQIKDEIRQRGIGMELLKFSGVAILHNLGVLELESLYSARWDLFELRGIKLLRLTVFLFAIRMCILSYLLSFSVNGDSLIGKTLPLLGITVLFFPQVIKTIIDIQNYKRPGR